MHEVLFLQKITERMKSRLSIIVTDLVLIVGLILCLVSDKNIVPVTAWNSFHCIACAAWYIVMAIHVYQHRKLIMALRIAKVRRKNILTTLTVIIFAVMFFSISALAAIQWPFAVHFHHVFVHIFMVVIIVHLVSKLGRLLVLIRNSKQMPHNRLAKTDKQHPLD